jgi:drug/metabolite transporter (DMT)-like permease
MLLQTVVALFGAWCSVRVRAGELAWPVLILVGAVSHSIWAYANRYSTMNLVQLSAWFDVVVALSWFVGFWWFGKETITAVQWVGIALLCAGLFLINWR